MDVIAGTKLNTFGGTGETHSAMRKFDFLGTILRAIGSNEPLQMTGVQLAKNIFGLE